MAESISRSLRDGCMEGEHAPALTIEDSLASSLGSSVFDHFLANLVSQIAAGKSQARGLVLVAFNRSPAFYLELLRRKGVDAQHVDKRVRILDCYSDPLGWKKRVPPLKTAQNLPVKANVACFSDARDTNKLMASILDLGKEFVGQDKSRFAVAIDLVSSLLRYTSLPIVAGLVNKLRSNDQTSCIVWLIHSDLHEQRVSAALAYVSTMVASIQPIAQCTDEQTSQQNSVWLGKNSDKAKLHVRLKRRNGRVKLLAEELHLDQVGVKFTAVGDQNSNAAKSLLPKVQFNLQLSEQERVERAKVVLPYEHQGNGEEIQIYDGRRSLSDSISISQPSVASPVISDTQVAPGIGEIHYVRDSDDEQPDSDEDPDDDLDI
ncbi:elongator complex protein 5-like [Zingiber officinale]|uniref:elongator complex protein 5-like n=1 Tax=Zingiber officinale TaxID=94328 RepID=UPI001C4B9D09|nr:elongator complex protein 5-like [Zingiber officinale]